MSRHFAFNNIYRATIAAAAIFIHVHLLNAVLRGTISLRNIEPHHGLVIPIVVPAPTAGPDELDDAFASSSDFWGSLDLNGDVKCGKYKCLFRQRTNHDGGNVTVDDSIAYLVGSNCRRFQFEMEMELSWKLAQYLRSTHRIKHLFLDAPRRVMLTPIAVDEVFNSKRLFKKSRRSCKRDPTYVKWNFTIVQKVRLVTDTMITIKKNTWTQFESYFDDEIVDKPLFVTNIGSHIGPALSAIESVPLLVHDFQILIDGRGNIYQFDLDRAFHAGLGGKLNDGRGYSGPGDFRETFVRDYDESMDILNFLSGWSMNRTRGDIVHPRLTIRRRGESVLLDHLRNNNSLSCEAVYKVTEMSMQEEMTSDAALMMVHLVDTALSLDRRRHDDEPEDSKNGNRNCSMKEYQF
jgi:hypothetical protein